MTESDFTSLRDTDLVLEDLPEAIVRSMALRDAWVASLPPTGPVEEFVVADLQKWLPGSTVRVAFRGGSQDLRREIAEVVTGGLKNICNISLDFGLNPETGAFREWSETDTNYAAEIRVSFNKAGYWSLVGTDSINASIGDAGADTGGRPHQRSLNLGGFEVFRPPSWRGTVLHEFLHALGFKHEHQNLRGPCENEFRWEDDEGYEATQDAQGRFVSDDAGRRPGIYTYLSGFPNNWPKAKVDFNLRTLHDEDLTSSEFDRASIMLYRFDPLFYKTNPSPCAPSGDGQQLSEGDVRGLRHLYPTPGSELAEIQSRRGALLSAVSRPEPELPGVETVPSVQVLEAIKILRWKSR